MVLWGLLQLTVSTIGGYNLARGVYNLYCDAEAIKEQYKKYQRITEQYKTSGNHPGHKPITESTYDRFEDEFLVLTKSMIIDPYH